MDSPKKISGRFVDPVNFEDLAMLTSVLTPKRLALLKSLRLSFI